MQPSEEQERPVFLERDKKFVIKWKLVKFLTLFLYEELNVAGKIVAFGST